ncbi:hypothetical protein EI77_00274 [Prosthecobacter fusiformis]|uniref:Uncharacterized protein n=1 Tax=Prosthecobacter fusiformis TaxID=48464 RepID=A0A4R7SP44_9BACT|nr:hypothetical protein [Prosthecobacter fusiformis]TDU80972.1 hypothetical protein EI77_00274 [Prosthecobacter fusiformis]
MRTFALGLALLSWSCFSPAASPEDAADYYDEATRRYLTLEKGEFGQTRLTVRFAGDPGSGALWMGQGQRTDKELIFTRIVGEGEAQGTAFIAKISESRIEIDYKPQQKTPQDAGINGTYRRLNESKLLQLAKKEFQAADERLQNSLRTAAKNWDRKDRPALDLWKDQWPSIRQRWLDVFTAQAKGTTLSPAENQPTAPKTAKDWVVAAQATARGYYFVEAMPDSKTGLGWDGEYDDLGAGHASLRLGADGRLRVSLASYRVPGDEAATLEGTAKPESITENKDGSLTAQFTLEDPEVKDPSKQAQVRLTKIGRYLHVETQNAERYAGRGWFSGIYRGSPVPAAP